MLPSKIKMVRATFEPLQSTSLSFHGWSASHVGRKSARMRSAFTSLHLPPFRTCWNGWNRCAILWILDPLVRIKVDPRACPASIRSGLVENVGLRIVHLQISWCHDFLPLKLLFSVYPVCPSLGQIFFIRTSRAHHALVAVEECTCLKANSKQPPAESSKQHLLPDSCVEASKDDRLEGCFSRAICVEVHIRFSIVTLLYIYKYKWCMHARLPSCHPLTSKVSVSVNASIDREQVRIWRYQSRAATTQIDSECGYLEQAACDGG